MGQWLAFLNVMTDSVRICAMNCHGRASHALQVLCREPDAATPPPRHCRAQEKKAPAPVLLYAAMFTVEITL